MGMENPFHGSSDECPRMVQECFRRAAFLEGPNSTIDGFNGCNFMDNHSVTEYVIKPIETISWITIA